MRPIFTFILLFILPTHIFGQDYFTVDRHRNVGIKEAYDGGYLLLSQGYLTGDPAYITKSNLKGDILWEIVLEPDYGRLMCTSMKIDAENNIYVAGSTGRHDTTLGSSFTLKLSPCGELVWIYFYGYNGYWDIVTDLNISDQNYLHTIYVQNYGVQNPETGAIENAGKLRHAKLNLDSDTIWSDVWPIVTGVDEHSKVIATNDGGSLVSMRTYHSYEGSPNYIRPTFFKIDSNGESEWITRIGIEDDILGSIYASGIELNDGSFVGIASRRYVGISGLFTPHFIKLDSNGGVLDFFPLIDDETISYDGAYHSFKKHNDNELILALLANPLDEGIPYYFSLYKLDNNGNILQSYINEEFHIVPKNMDISENGDILIAFQISASDEPNNTHVYRFDGETLEPIPIPEEDNNEYDTLCPEGIAMTEYSFPTSEDLGQSQLTISNGMAFQLFPNPVQDQLSLQWTAPHNELTESWIVECHDIFGKLIYSTEVTPTNRSLGVNTSTWNHGLYIMTIKNKTQVIYQHKLVK